MNYLSQYYKNLSEQLQEKVVILQKAINEAGRPTFIPMTVAYDDSGDAEPNVATLRNDEETDLRVDNFGGQYPDAGYAKIDRSRRESESNIQAVHNELYYAKERAKKSHMNNTTYRGRAVSSYPNYTKVSQQAETDFNQTYVPSVSLTDRFKGLITTRNITRGILQKHPEHEAFLQSETERAKGIR